MTSKYLIVLALGSSLFLIAPSPAAQEGDGPTEVELPEEEGPSEVELPQEEGPSEVELPEEESPSEVGLQKEQPATPPPTKFGKMPNTQPAEPKNQPPPRTAPTRQRQPEKTPLEPEPYQEPQLMEDPIEEEEEENEVFSWFSLVPQIGYLFFPEGQMEVNGFNATVDQRNGLVAKLHFDLGGDGIAFEIAPIFALEVGGINTDATGFGNLSTLDLSQGFSGANFLAVGGQIGIVYRFDVGKFFPHLGLTFYGTYLTGSEIDYGTELYGRIPIGFTAYMGEHIAFVLEVGLMYGATGIKMPLKLPEVAADLPNADVLEAAQTPSDFEAWYETNQGEIDQWIVENQDNLPKDYSSKQMQADMVSDQLSKSIRFGAGFGLDITIGIRFP
jgi:hypothetical protein